MHQRATGQNVGDRSSARRRPRRGRASTANGAGRDTRGRRGPEGPRRQSSSSGATTLLDRVRATGVVVPGAPLAVGCSGGRDSLCLLDVLATTVGAPGLLAVHVHHGLRGAAADGDALRAAETARRLGVAVRVVRLAVPDAVARTPGAPTLWAREARRNALRAAADAWGGPGTPVAVAHTASDQAETVLLRAISSPGSRALAGIAVRDEARGVVRPLLAAGVTRDQVRAWCVARGLRWRDDASNPVSPRGRVRALLAALEAIDGRASGALVRTAARAREDDQALTAAAGALVAASGGRELALGALRAAPTAVGRRALRRLAEDALGRPCSRVEARLEEVLALRPQPGRSAALDVGDGVRVVVADATVRCVATPPLRG